MGAQVENPALHLVRSGLGQLHQAVGLKLGLLDDALGVLARGLADVLGNLLRGEQRVLEDGLALLVLLEERLQVLELLLEHVAVALECGELLGDEMQVRPYLVLVEAAETAAKGLPLDVHGRYLHRGLLPSEGI